MSAFNYENLDETTRRHMHGEVEYDLARSALYRGAYLTDRGWAAYPDLLRKAVGGGTDFDLACGLDAPGMQLAFNPRGHKVRHDAAQQLAAGEFNRFYIRALARRADEEGLHLEVYRAKEVRKPRYTSWQREGTIITEPAELLADLRTNIGVEVRHHVPGGPGSGLSVRLIEPQS